MASHEKATKLLNREDAENTALLLKNVAANSEPVRSILLKQVASMTQKHSAEELSRFLLMKPVSDSADDKVHFEQFILSAQLALDVKNNPVLMTELLADPHHPRFLTFFDQAVDEIERSTPELFRLILEDAALIAELEVAIGEKNMNEVTSDISKKAKQLSDPQLKFPDALSGATFTTLAVVTVMKQEPFVSNPQFTPSIWGQLLAYYENKALQRELREKAAKASKE